MTAYDRLMAYQRQTEAFAKVATRLGWDQETVMPDAAISERSEEMAAMEQLLHSRRTSNELGDLLSAAAGSGETPVQQRMIDLITKDYERTLKVPEDLAVALAKTTSKAHRDWITCRANNDFQAFVPVLSEVVHLRQQEGQALSDGTDMSAYDALLQDYEPGNSTLAISEMFDALRGPLVDLRSDVLSRPAAPEVKGHFPKDKQLELGQFIAETFGYDMSRGRIDLAVHPFCSGNGADVRVTTRVDETEPLGCIYSVIHEVGHASYEQNIHDDFAFTPAGHGCSMGIHESQSRIYENQLGRSRAFTGWLFGQLRDRFGDIGVQTEEEFYAAVNAVRNGYIRTESDELQYNLHVMMRFDLERDLMLGDLAVPDLEAAWNDRFSADFGFEVDCAANGVLQDVHWSEGLFGYFPTYSLGNVYAGCLYEALQKAVPNLEDNLAQGDTKAATDWLCQNLQVHGASQPADVLMTQATGQAPSVQPFITYIRSKFA